MYAARQSPRSSYEAERQRLEKATPYPNGIYSWKDFVAQYRNLPEAPFVVVLQKVPHHYETHLSLQLSQEVFFGIMTERRDGKLGKLCFGRASKEFGGVEHTLPAGIFIEDGFSPAFLHTWTGETLKEFNHKVVDVCTDHEEVMSKLARWLRRMVGDEKGYCPKTEPEAANLVRLRNHLRQFLPLCQSSRSDDDIRGLVEMLEAELEAWDRKLEAQASDLWGQLFSINHQRRLIRK